MIVIYYKIIFYILILLAYRGVYAGFGGLHVGVELLVGRDGRTLQPYNKKYIPKKENV